jgi:hypothetical protein
MSTTASLVLSKTEDPIIMPMGCPVTQPGVVTRPVRAEDFEMVHAFFLKTGRPGPSASAWSWMWRENPALKASPNRHPAGWTLSAGEGAGRRIVGYMGNVIERHHVDNRSVFSATGIFRTVLPAYRKEAWRLDDAFMNQPGISMLRTNVPDQGDSSNLIWIGQPFRGDAEPSGRWVIKPHRALSHGRRLRWAWRLDRAVPPLASLALKLSGQGIVRPRGAQPDLNTLMPAQIGARFDTLWKHLRDAAEGPLAWRDARTLRWHCSNPGGAPLRMITCSRTIHLLGYAILGSDIDAATGVSHARILDLQVSPAAVVGVRDWLIWAAARQAESDGHHILEACGPGLPELSHAVTQAPGSRDEHRAARIPVHDTELVSDPAYGEVWPS